MRTAIRLLLILAVMTPTEVGSQQGAPDDTMPAPPGVHALIIGIADYAKFPSEQRLRYAHRDAQLFHDVLQTSPLAPSLKGVTLLSNSSAGRRAILDAVRTLGSAAGPDDLLYVFFSGHGILDSSGRAFIMPADADPALPEHNGIRVDHFVELIAASTQSRSIVLLIDASREADIAPAVLNAFSKHFGARDGNYIALLSARGGQRSYEDPNFESGLFTWYLVEGLEGRADLGKTGNQDGLVTMRELYRHVVEQVEDRAEQAFRKIQTPIIWSDYDPLFLPASFGAVNTLPDTLSPEDIGRHLERAARLEEAQDYHGASQAYERVLELDSDHPHARSRLGFILEEYLFEYEEARTVISYWVDRADTEPDKLAEYAQTLFTTERFEEHEAFVSGLLATGDFDERLEIVLRALQIANFVALDMDDRAFSSLASLVAELSRRHKSFTTDWSFGGVKHFIKENERFGTHQAWLVEVFDALESEKGDDLINRIRSMR